VDRRSPATRRCAPANLVRSACPPGSTQTGTTSTPSSRQRYGSTATRCRGDSTRRPCRGCPRDRHRHLHPTRVKEHRTAIATACSWPRRVDDFRPGDIPRDPREQRLSEPRSLTWISLRPARVVIAVSRPETRGKRDAVISGRNVASRAAPCAVVATTRRRQLPCAVGSEIRVDLGDEVAASGPSCRSPRPVDYLETSADAAVALTVPFSLRRCSCSRRTLARRRRCRSRPRCTRILEEYSESFARLALEQAVRPSQRRSARTCVAARGQRTATSMTGDDCQPSFGSVGRR